MPFRLRALTDFNFAKYQQSRSNFEDELCWGRREFLFIFSLQKGISIFANVD